MPKPLSRPAGPKHLRRLLETLAVPAFQDHADPLPDEQELFEVAEEDQRATLHGMLCEGQLCRVRATPIDDTHSLLGFDLLAGYLPAATADAAMIVGQFLGDGPFHIRTDAGLANVGQLSVGCDLVVRPDDEPLVRRRVGELLQLGHDLDWFFPLRMPNRLQWWEVHQLEIPWDELPHADLDGFLDQAMQVPPSERTPLTLLAVAQGLGRWKEVLQLLREHPDELPGESLAPLKAMACRELGRWLPAIRAARAGGLRRGRYPDSPWISPSYLHALIEAGDDIEALRLLRRRDPGEPGFYEWFRAFALHRAGDHEGAKEAFDRYFSRWDGDLIGGIEAGRLAEEIP